jgi:hypothetical protein
MKLKPIKKELTLGVGDRRRLCLLSLLRSIALLLFFSLPLGLFLPPFSFLFSLSRPQPHGLSFLVFLSLTLSFALPLSLLCLYTLFLLFSSSIFVIISRIVGPDSSYI